MKRIGSMNFWFSDDRENIDESIDCTFAVNGENGEFTLEEYWSLCRYFAAAMGFSEKSINEWFGSY